MLYPRGLVGLVRPARLGAAVIEKKVSAGAETGAATGLLIWALVTWVPSFRAGVPEPVAAVLPFALGWLGHVMAAWAAPHTARPDLKPAGPPSNGEHP